MPGETVGVLKEIAALLRQRIEISKRTNELYAQQLAGRKDSAEDRTSQLDDLRQKHQEQQAETQTRFALEREQRKQREDEEREFKQQLLSELRRHNALLEQLLTR